jgi:hypothetical protein
MKTKYLKILIVALAGAMLGGCGDYPPLETSGEIFVNRTLLNIYTGDKVQLAASPVDAAFRWSSNNESVVTVNQRGLVEAVAPGVTEITVSNGTSQVSVPVVATVPTADNVAIVGETDSLLVLIQTLSERISTVRVFWNNDNDSIDIDVNNRAGIFTDTIVSSGEIFKVVCIDSLGNKSLASEMLKISSFRHRTIFSAIKRVNKLFVEWSSDVRYIDHCILSYINTKGNNASVEVYPEEVSTVINDYSSDLILNTVFVLDNINLGPVAVKTVESTPFKGPHRLTASNPYVLSACDFDIGGEGVGFHDADSKRDGDNYRADNGDETSQAVDMEGNGNNIGWSETGEWLIYTLEVRDAGTYFVDVAVSVNDTEDKGRLFNVYMDDLPGGQTKARGSNGFTNWYWVYEDNSGLLQPQYYLSTGKHIFKFVFDEGGNFNLRAFRFTRTGN